MVVFPQLAKKLPKMSGEMFRIGVPALYYGLCSAIHSPWHCINPTRFRRRDMIRYARYDPQRSVLPRPITMMAVERMDFDSEAESRVLVKGQIRRCVCLESEKFRILPPNLLQIVTDGG